MCIVALILLVVLASRRNHFFMRVVCSYCGAPLGETEPLEDESLSHGMCLACRDHFARQWRGERLGEYLDSFSKPVLVVTGDERRIVAANQAMADLLRKSDRELFGLLGGEAIECVNARRPEGCGNTIHCRTCTIRRTVSDVLQTGESRIDVPATIRAGEGTVDYLISARRGKKGTVEVDLEIVSGVARQQEKG